MTSLGFENYAEALKIYLSKYREVSHSFPTLSSLPTSPLRRVLQSSLMDLGELSMTEASRPSQPEVKINNGPEVGMDPAVPRLGQAAVAPAAVPLLPLRQQPIIRKVKVSTAS